MSDRFIPVIFPHYIIEAQGDYVAPLGHAGFISVSGTGAATYYDFGRYGSGQSGVFTNHDSTTGNVRKTELGTAQLDRKSVV